MNLSIMLRKTLSGLLAGAVLLALIAAGTARAELPGRERVPGDALVAIGIADTAQFWSRTGALSVSQAISQYLASPQLTSSLPFQQFTLERQKLEQKLGFPLTAQEVLGNVFSTALITLEPRAQGKPTLNVALGVKDKAKAGKVIAALDDMGRQMAADTAQTTQGTAQAEKVTFENIDLFKAKVSHLHYQNQSAGAGDIPQDVYYALAGDKLVFSSGREELGRAIQNTKAEKTLDANPEFAKLTKSLPWAQADVSGWMDSAAILQLTNNQMLQMMRKMAPTENEKIAFTVQMAPDGMVAQVASSGSPVPAGSALKPRRLAGMSFLGPNPMVALVYGMLDAGEAYKNFNSFLNALSLAGSMSGQQGAAPMGNPLADLEQKMGISIQNDLVPALGSEMLLSLNSLQISLGGGAPNVDLVLGVEVRDEARMRSLMTKLEGWLETQLAGMGGPGGGPGGAPNQATAPKFQNAGPGLRTLATSQPALSPAWAIAGKYLLIGLNPTSVQGALGRARSAQAAATPAYAELARLAGTDQIFSYSVVDVRQATQTILMPLLSMLMLTNQASLSMQDQQNLTAILTQILPRIGTAASLETVKDGVALGYMKVKM